MFRVESPRCDFSVWPDFTQSRNNNNILDTLDLIFEVVCWSQIKRKSGIFYSTTTSTAKMCLKPQIKLVQLIHLHLSICSISICTAQRWFQRVRSGVEVDEYAPRSGKPDVEKCDKIAEFVERHRHSSSRSFGQELGMKKLGFTKTLDAWVPHELTQTIIFDRIDACELLLNRNKIAPILRRMVTGDDNWVTYDNVKRKRSRSKRGEAAQTAAKPGLTARNVLLCVRWDWQGIIHYELHPYGQTLNSDLYCQQFNRLQAALMPKRP